MSKMDFSTVGEYNTFEEWFAANDPGLVAERERIAGATKELTNVLRKYYPDERGNLSAPEVLAAALELFDGDDPKNAGQLYLEWLVEHYVGRKVAANLDDIRKVVEALRKAGGTEEAAHEYNDCDNRLFYIPHDKKLIFCAEGQNTRYIYILIEGGLAPQLHIRRYYDEYDFEGRDKWELEEAEVYTKKGIAHAISHAHWLNERWSDCIEGNRYPQRLSLQHFKECDFELEYGDCRDNGYVLSYTNWMDPRAEHAISFYPDVKHAFFELRCAAGQLIEKGE